MANSQNDIDIYYAVGNANTKRQENEIASIMKIRNQAGRKLTSTSRAVVDNKINFQIFIFFSERIYSFSD